MVFLPKRFRRKFYKVFLPDVVMKHPPLQALAGAVIWLVSLFIGYVVLFKFIESVNWTEAIWQGWQTFTTVGYGNKPADTIKGRWLTMGVATWGIGWFGVFISSLFDLKQYNKDIRRLGQMKNKFTNGYVIVNYPGERRLATFLEEIRDREEDVGICVVDNRIEELPAAFKMDQHMHFVRGSSLEDETFEQANVRENKVAVVFPKDPSNPESDAETKVIVQLLRGFMGNGRRIIPVLAEGKNLRLFNTRNCQPVLYGVAMLALVQECQDPGTAAILEQLVRNTEGANPQTVVPKLITGWTWGKFMRCVSMASKKTDVRCNPLAIVRKGKPDACPLMSEVIQEGDMLSVIANNDFDWDVFEDAVVNNIPYDDK